MCKRQKERDKGREIERKKQPASQLARVGEREKGEKRAMDDRDRESEKKDADTEKERG